MSGGKHHSHGSQTHCARCHTRFAHPVAHRVGVMCEDCMEQEDREPGHTERAVTA